MSHFTVGVILKDINDLEKVLAPFQENNMDDCPKEFLKFFDVEEECRKEYENNTSECVVLDNGEIVSVYDSRFRYGIPQSLTKLEIPHIQRFSSFEHYMTEWKHYKKDQETGKWGYWENPNAKWDWWTIGGRWSGSILLKSGDKTDYGKIKDIFFLERDQTTIDKPHKQISEFIIPADMTTDFMNSLEEAIKNESDYWDKAVSRSPKYFVDNYESKENFVKQALTPSTYAVIASDGKWYSKGEMGWFGTSSETKEVSKEFDDNFYECFIKNVDPEYYYVIVDCHI